MSRPHIPAALRRKIAHEAGHRCSYCLVSQLFTAMPMHIEHIVPVSAGGTSTEENLCLACPLCNGYKGIQTHYLHPETGLATPLFNPRQQKWWSHFRWSQDGTEIIGLTPTGEVTVLALRLSELPRRKRTGYHLLS
ncbi:MAG: HNH endonuclease signature motif containing protein [Chloroflexota bacterium]